MNYDIVHADETPCENILDTIATAPFLTAKRLVIIKGLDDADDDTRKRILTALERTPAYTDVVLDVKQPLGTDAIRLLQNRLIAQNFAKPTDSSLLQLIAKEFSDKKKKISPAAITYLRERVGKDSQRICNEIEKLIVFAGKRDTITIDDIDRIVVGDVHETAFALLDFIGTKETKKALIVCETLGIDRNNITEILGLIASHLRKIRRIAALKRGGISDSQIRNQVGIGDYAFMKLSRQVTSLKSREIITAQKIILQIDADLKAGKLGPKEAMTLAVVKLCGGDDAS